MPEIIIRTSNPRTEGGNLDDLQISYRVEAVDADTGAVLAFDDLWLSSKGVNNDPETAAAATQEAAEQWAASKLAHKMAELETAKPLLDAIAAAPEVRRTTEQLQAVVRGEVIDEIAAEQVTPSKR